MKGLNLPMKHFKYFNPKNIFEKAVLRNLEVNYRELRDEKIFFLNMPEQKQFLSWILFYDQ